MRKFIVLCIVGIATLCVSACDGPSKPNRKTLKEISMSLIEAGMPMYTVANLSCQQDTPLYLLNKDGEVLHEVTYVRCWEDGNAAFNPTIIVQIVDGKIVIPDSTHKQIKAFVEKQEALQHRFFPRVSACLIDPTATCT